MLVYWDRRRAASTAAEFAALRGADALDVLIGLGEIEAGVADALFPERDGDCRPARELRRLSVEAARAWLDGRAFAFEPPDGLPQAISLGIPEGYAYYGLYPEMYVEAAERFAAECLDGGESPSVGVVGIRGIGTSLSAVVTAALERAGCRVESWTVRPRGHPFARRVELDAPLEAAWRARADRWWAVVDEGPGLSGSSLTSVAAKLAELGASDARIVLFPSWETSGEQFVSADARRRWPRHRKYTGQFRAPEGLDISAGGWRRLLYPDGCEWPAVQPQHERRKYLAGKPGERTLLKFAGLGRFGRAKLERAERLWRAGFGPRPLGFENGFLRMEWVEGRPARKITPVLLEIMARYLDFLRSEYQGGQGASSEELRAVIRVNTGREWMGEAPCGQPCRIDGRMLPHEWIETERGYIKADALDHHDGHFLPGCQPIAWDVAGAVVEFGLDAAAASRLAKACRSGSGLSFYIAAYSAFRAGYATLAARALDGTPEAERFAALAGRYAARA
ncbi:MAG: hypothetical protein ACM3ZB_04385 [bacterium]